MHRRTAFSVKITGSSQYSFDARIGDPSAQTTNSKTSKNGVNNGENAPSNQHHPKVTSEVTSEVIRLLNTPFLEARAEELMMLLHIKHKDDFRRRYIVPALKLGFIERTQPNSPRSPTQKYRLTAKGQTYLEQLNTADNQP